MSASVTHVDFRSRKARKHAEHQAAGGWPVLVAKPLRSAETGTANPENEQETAV
ncbi:hypothetical protein AB0I28_33205 [Phytomonospora sp. NPDC050363]|uniref:hypothetical protein n=1 Tax=Phytomonospora sp. NPDC050363 TaxID=3155642 RepID=UPI0033E2709B